VKIRVEIEEPDARVRTSHAVADYVRAMLRIRSLRRAVGEALLEAEHCKKKLKAAQVLEAHRLLEGADRSPARSPLLRRPTKRPS
jgi:hypothetical protein